MDHLDPADLHDADADASSDREVESRARAFPEACDDAASRPAYDACDDLPGPFSSPGGLLRFFDGEWYRKDGRSVRVVIGPEGDYLLCPATGRREAVDALSLATWTAYGRLVPDERNAR